MFTQPGTTGTTLATPVFDHRPTVEQAAILDAASTGNPLVVTAGAGTGKTSTLKMVAASTMKRGLYLAYNRAIADDARASFPYNVDCRTAHSLAFQVVGRQFAHRLNGPRMPAREVARLLSIPQVLDLGAHALTSPKVARVVMDTISRFCHSDWETPGGDHIPHIPGLDDPASIQALKVQLTPMVHRAWEDLTNPQGRLRFTHDHYLKMWALTRPTLPADLIFLDEAQDANPVIAAIVDDQDSQKILVGDESQAIYGWRGAVDAMASFSGMRLSLTQSFRFGQRIADEANMWLDLLSAPLRLTGNPAKDSRLEQIPAPQAVLCRTNAGAIGQIIAAIGAQQRPALVGGGDDIRRLAEACRDLRTGRGTMHPELMAFTSWQEVKDYAEHDAGGQDLKTLVKLIDSYGPDAVIKVVDQLVDEHNATIIISTAHKAKGREWGTVRLAADFAPPYDKDGDLIPAEAMLTYVAVTRAKDGLDPIALPMYGGGGLTVPLPPVDQLPFDVLIPDPEPIPTDLPPAMVGWLGIRNEAASNEKRWKEIREQAEEKLKEHLGEREEATVNGRPAISWKTSKPGTQLNSKALEKDHPTIYAAYLVEKKPARPFKILGDQ
ncbi:UvrD-helicase domain-containing protein [Streptosporangium sp. NPDC006930]|uniref:UvrD-helicase domain-containing protein n=1 Tax=Streptosporangium sp. NPDC006930 TaxID=3154783 RepID=UPI0034248B61